MSNHDPFSGAMVLSRGIVGSRGDRPTVASPVYKQVFDLATGQCLDDPAVRLPVHLVRVRDGLVEVALEARSRPRRSAPERRHPSSCSGSAMRAHTHLPPSSTAAPQWVLSCLTRRSPRPLSLTPGR